MGQQRFQKFEGFVEDLSTLLERHAIADELVGKGAASETQLDAPVGKDVGEGDLAGQAAHVVQGQDDDGGGDRDRFRHRGDLDRQHQGVGIHQHVHEVMLGDGEPAIARLFPELRYFEHLAV